MSSFQIFNGPIKSYVNFCENKSVYKQKNHAQKQEKIADRSISYIRFPLNTTLWNFQKQNGLIDIQIYLTIPNISIVLTWMESIDSFSIKQKVIFCYIESYRWVSSIDEIILAINRWNPLMIPIKSAIKRLKYWNLICELVYDLKIMVLIKSVIIFSKRT